MTDNTIYIPAGLILALDEQLTRLNALAHVCASRLDSPTMFGFMPILVAVSYELAAPVRLEHPELESYIQAEYICARANAMQGASDDQRMAAVIHMQESGCLCLSALQAQTREGRP